MHLRWWVRASCQELVSVLCIKEIQSGADGYIRDWWYWHNAGCECVCVWAWINYMFSMCVLHYDIRVWWSHILYLCCVCVWDCVYSAILHIDIELCEHFVKSTATSSCSNWLCTAVENGGKGVWTRKKGSACSCRWHTQCENMWGPTEGLDGTTLQDFTFIKLHVSLGTPVFLHPVLCSVTVFHFVLSAENLTTWLRTKVSWLLLDSIMWYSITVAGRHSGTNLII